MKKYSVIIAAVAASALSFTAQANIAPVTPVNTSLVGLDLQGGIAFSGLYTANGTGTGQLGLNALPVDVANPSEGGTADAGSTLATQANLSGTVIATSGYFASYIPTVLGSGLVFNNAVTLLSPLLGAQALTPVLFYAIQPGGAGNDVLAFYETGITSNDINNTANSASWTIHGTGFFEEFDSTGTTLVAGGTGDDGYWTLALTANGLQVDSGTGTFVPDGGMTVALLGGALVALQAFRRKLL